MFLGAYAEHGVIGENTTSSPSRANRFRKIPRCFAKLDEEDATGELSGSQQDRALHLTCHSSFQQRISEELGDSRYQHPSHSYVFGKCLGQSPSTGNLDRCWAAGYGEVHPRGCSSELCICPAMSCQEARYFPYIYKSFFSKIRTSSSQDTSFLSNLHLVKSAPANQSSWPKELPTSRSPVSVTIHRLKMPYLHSPTMSV